MREPAGIIFHTMGWGGMNKSSTRVGSDVGSRMKREASDDGRFRDERGVVECASKNVSCRGDKRSNSSSNMITRKRTLESYERLELFPDYLTQRCQTCGC